MHATISFLPPLPCPLARRHQDARARAVSRRVAGFTAVELLVTIAVLGVLSALAAPSFTPLLEGWRVNQATGALESTLHLARAEAIKRGGNVLIQKLPNNTNGCTTAGTATEWDCGWFVCHDTNGNGSCTASEPVLQRVDAPSQVHITRTGGAATIKLSRWGTISGTYIGFNLTPKDKTISHSGARGLCMSSGGRIRVVKGSDIPCNG